MVGTRKVCRRMENEKSDRDAYREAESEYTEVRQENKKWEIVNRREQEAQKRERKRTGKQEEERTERERVEKEGRN